MKRVIENCPNKPISNFRCFVQIAITKHLLLEIDLLTTLTDSKSYCSWKTPVPKPLLRRKIHVLNLFKVSYKKNKHVAHDRQSHVFLLILNKFSCSESIIGDNRSSHQRRSVKKAFLEISQTPFLQNTYGRLLLS